MQINTNGILVLLNEKLPCRDTLSYFKNDSFPIEGHVFIAPFYGNIETQSNETVWYSRSVINDSDLLKEVKDHVQLTKNYDFSPKYLLIATWDGVGYYDKRNDKVGIIPWR